MNRAAWEHEIPKVDSFFSDQTLERTQRRPSACVPAIHADAAPGGALRGYYRRHSDRCQRGSLDIPLPGTLILMKFRIDNELYGLNGPSDDLW